MRCAPSRLMHAAIERSLPPGSRRSAGLAATLAALLVGIIAARPAAAQDFSHPQTRPAPQSALVQLANDALAAGDFASALKMLATLNAQTPNNPQVLYNLGTAVEALEATAPAAIAPATTAPAATDGSPATADPKSASAESYYRQSIAANPLFPAPHIALGLLLARAGRTAEAHAELLAATTLADADPALKARAFRALARIDLNGDSQHHDAPNSAAALEDLLAALKLSPESPDDILLSAEIAQATPDLATAEQAYRRYLALPENQASPHATASLAHVLLAEHHPAEAEALLTPALAAHPGDPTLTAQLAAAYLASVDPAKSARAAPLLESLHTNNPADPSITRLLARVYLETGHPDLADPLYAALIAAGPNPDPTLLDDRAEVLLRLHRPGAAESLLKQALANPSAFPTPAALGDAATHLAFAASEIDDPRTTLQALSLRATVLPPSPSSLFLEATANDMLHQNAKAVDLYRQFIAAAQGDFPEQESQARQRLAALEHRK